MDSEGKAPHRAFVAEITVGGDTRQDMIASLRHVIETLQRGSDQSVSGGYSTCHLLSVKHDPEMTHDRFIELLNQYLGGMTQT